MRSIDPTRQRALEAAVRDHRSGRLRDAVRAYEKLLRDSNEDADVLQLMGVAQGQLGNHEGAAACLMRSLELQPDRPSVILNLAQALRSLGRDAEALHYCDRALALDPSLAGAYRLRGAAHAALGRLQDAIANYGHAARLTPNDANVFLDLGTVLDQAGRTADALVCFDRAIELNPQLAPAHHNRGIASARSGEHARALQSFDRALALQPQSAAIHNNRANTLKELGRLTDALESYSLALAIEPGNTETLHNRAVVLALLGRYTEALRDYEDLRARGGEQAGDLVGRGASLVALGRNEEALVPLQEAAQRLPHEPEAHIQYGLALLRLNRYEQALASFDRALSIEPNRPGVLINRAIALVELDRVEQALVTLQSALELDREPADVYTNLGLVYRSLGRNLEALASFRQALDRKPGDPAATFALAFVHLSLGDFAAGWPLYEARFDEPALGIPKRVWRIARWKGEPLAGKTLLVHAEQGLGDAIQFCRYLPLLVAQGADVIFEVMPALKALLTSLPGPIRIVARGEPAPAADYQCPLLSLPLELGTDAATIPAPGAYLAAEPQRLERWRARLAALPGLRVGIAWQGNLAVEQLIWARGRSMPLAQLAPLAQLPGVSLISLQKGEGAQQIRTVDFGSRIIDLGQEIDQSQDAFLDTAAVMAHLDLIISTDTSIAHLAGALARPAWIALSSAPEWRWLLERSDSPWYPTFRLFRQRRRGDWRSVVTPMAEALAKMANGGV
jgi:tetratricopeptide (TPR) repeat protein